MLNDRYKGQIFGGYKLLSQLADGKGSQIYLAQSTTVAGPMVAVKILSGASFISLPSKGLFRENFQRLLDFKDEYVLPLIDVGIERRQPYLVMEHVTGGSLRQKLEQDGPLPFSSDAALTLITKIGQALDHAHREGIVHGNLEPENILFDDDGRPLLTNFDVSTATNSASQELSSGSLSHYLSPEQCIQGIKSSAGDQYALASIAYELLTGRTPFTEFDPLLRLVLLTREPTPPRRINASISLHAERALLKALAKKPTDRYETTAAFVSALRAAPQLTVRVYDQDQVEDSLSSSTPLTEETTEPIEKVTELVEQVTEPTAVATLVLPGSEAHEEDSVLVLPGSEAHEEDSVLVLPGPEAHEEDSVLVLPGSETHEEDFAAISAGANQDLPKSMTIPLLAAPFFKDGQGSVVRRFPLAILLALLLVFGSIFLLFNNFQPHRAQFTIKTGTQLAVQEQLTSLPTSSSIISTPLPTNLQTATSVSTLKLKMTATPISLATMPHPSSIAGSTTSKSLVPGSGVTGASGTSTVNNTGTVNRVGSVPGTPGAPGAPGVPTTTASAPAPAPAPASPPTPAPAVTAPASLVGSLSSSPQALNLTSEGSLDWAEWGYDGFDHKAGGGSQISGSSLVGNSTTQSSCSNPVVFSWGDGAPIGSVGSETCNEWTYTQGNGFQFTVQGSTQMRTLKVYVGIGSAQGVFTATCSDGKGGTLQYRDTSLVNYSGQANGVYTLSYRTPSPGQSLTVTFTILSVQNNAGAIDLEAATLQ